MQKAAPQFKHKVTFGSTRTTYFKRIQGYGTLQQGPGLALSHVPICGFSQCRGCDGCTKMCVDGNKEVCRIGAALPKLSAAHRKLLLAAAGITAVTNREVTSLHRRFINHTGLFCTCIPGACSKLDTKCECSREGVGCFADSTSNVGCSCCVDPLTDKCPDVPNSYKFDQQATQKHVRDRLSTTSLSNK